MCSRSLSLYICILYLINFLYDKKKTKRNDLMADMNGDKRESERVKFAFTRVILSFRWLYEARNVRSFAFTYHSIIDTNCN